MPGKKIYQYILFSVTPLFIAAICPAAADVVSAHFMSGGMLLQALRGVTSELITGLSIFAILLLMLLELSSVLISYTHGFIFKALSAFMKMWIVPLIISVMIGFSAVALYIQ